MTQPFRYYLRVRYQDCDAQHVVFNARYGDYIDLACFEFLRAVGDGLRPESEAEDLLDIPAFLRRQAD